MASRLLGQYPDYGKAPPAYVASMVETLSWLTDAEIADLMHPRTGIGTVCKFLPTTADIHDFLRQKREAAEQFTPRTTWPKLDPEADPPGYQTDAEKRRAFVTKKLGYSPVKMASAPEPRVFSRDDLPATLDLKTPPRPASDELKQLLAADGFGFLIASGESEAA